MKFGLSDDQIRQVQTILSKYPAITEAVVFGSRAMGNYKEASDVDVALKGDVTLSMVADVKYVLEEDTYLPFFFDIIAYGIINAPKLKEHIDKYGEVLYRSGWQVCRLADKAEFKNGKSRPSEIEAGTIPIYGGNGILGYTNMANSQGTSVVIGRVGAYCGSVFYENKPIWVSDNALYATPKSTTDIKFLYYLLKNMDLNSHAEGSGHPLLTQTLLNSLSVTVPNSLQEQREIAAALSSLDDKIDLLHRQNKTLEGLASILWWNMFVEKADPEWQKVCMSEIIEVRDGTHDSPKQTEDGFYLVTSRHLKEEGIDYANAYKISEQDYKQISRRSKVDKNDLLFSMIGTLGLIHYVDEEPSYAIKNIGLFKCSKKPEFAKYLYLLLKSPIGKDFIFENADGSTQEYISLGGLRSFSFAYPGDRNIKLFDEMIEPYFNKIHGNKQQIRKLAHLRDTLLPKLMSGEVRVKT